MTHSINHPEADYTPNDIGPPDRVGINKPLTAEEREEYEKAMLLDDPIF